MMRLSTNAITLLAAVFLATQATCAAAEKAEQMDGLPLICADDFEKGMDKWQPTDVEKKSWKIIKTEHGKSLRVTGKSDYQPPVRSPHSIAWLKDVTVGDFILTAKIQSTNSKAGPHRDLCFFWGRQDASHFYYVHFGAKADPHACQIFIVNDKPRIKITVNEAKGTPWTDGWHDVKIVRKVKDGTIEVYFDDMTKPLMTAKDTTFTWGQVGVGTFDDHGHFDDIKLYGKKVNKPKK